MSGRRLLRRDTTENLLRGTEGRVREALVASSDLAEFRERHPVSRAVRTPDGVRARVLADTPPVSEAVPVTPGLEDAYLLVVPAAKGRAFGALVVGSCTSCCGARPGGGCSAFLPRSSLVWWFPRIGSRSRCRRLGLALLIRPCLGTQQREHGIHLLVGSSPAHRRRLVDEWLAGLFLAAFVGLGSLVSLGSLSRPRRLSLRFY